MLTLPTQASVRLTDEGRLSRGALRGLLIASGLSAAVGVLLVATAHARTSIPSFVIAAVGAGTYFVLSRPWHSRPPHHYKGIYTNAAVRQMAGISVLFCGGTVVVIYKAAQDFRYGSAITGVLEIVAAVCGAALGTMAVLNVIAILRLRSGHAGRFSRRWIKQSFQDAAEGRD
jgi:uncharacterized membrane protein YfcA